MTKPKLLLTTDDPYVVYGPGDKIRGKAKLELTTPLLAKYIIVSLLAGCKVSHRDGRPNKQNFFHKQFQVPFHNKRGTASKELAPGQHKWPFDFAIPSTNDLPPSFYYRDELGSIEISYWLVACIYRYIPDGSRARDEMTTLKVKYLPKRSPSIGVDAHAPLSLLPSSVHVSRYPDQSLPLCHWKRIPRFIQRTLWKNRITQERFNVTLWLPRHAVFTDHLDIFVKLQREVDDPPLTTGVKLSRVEYRLSALTRITHEAISRSRCHQIQRCACTCSAFLEANGGWISLRANAPFRVHPNLLGMPVDKNTFTTLGPSFSSNHVVREYVLDIDLFLVIYEQTHRVRYEHNEIILLPQELYVAAA